MRVAVCSLFCLAGCYKNHLFIHQEKFDAYSLASARVESPDPRSDDPAIGQKLLIAWDFPKSLFDRGLTLNATIRLWDNQEQLIQIPIERKRDTTSYFFPSCNKILTYRVQIVAQDGQLVDTWAHHFWTPLIQIEETNASVSSHPKQSSVIETP